MKGPSLLRSCHFGSGMAPHWPMGDRCLTVATMNILMSPSLLLILILLVHMISMMVPGYLKDEGKVHGIKNEFDTHRHPHILPDQHNEEHKLP